MKRCVGSWSNRMAEEVVGSALTSMRPKAEEMKGLGLGRWMAELGTAFSQLLSHSFGTGSCEYSVLYQGSTSFVRPCSRQI